MAWYGIPYAAPPLGTLRWRAPRPAPAWQGEFQAIDRSSRCLQLASGFEPGFEEGDLAGTEDCLHLNIWAPATTPSRPLPVMFWIHGGGNVWGFAGQYEMGALAQRENLIVVAVNYRLGPFGWFAHQAIRDTAETPLDRSPNFAILDLVAALDWVRANISAFGGDPENLTVFGESAGGFNTATLLASPLASGKIRRAIIQSGAFTSSTLAAAEQETPIDSDKPRISSSDLVNALVAAGELQTTYQGAELAEQLRRIPGPTLMQRFREMQGNNSLFGGINVVNQIADGIAIPREGMEHWLDDHHAASNVPVMLGVNRDEAMITGLGDGELTNNLFNIIFWPTDDKLYRANGEYPSRLWFALGVTDPARRLLASGKGPVYTYRFDWDEQGRALLTDVSELVGATHALEVAFVTGGFQDRVSDPLGVYFNERNQAAREALSAIMMSYWAEFAYRGSPGQGRSGNLPAWKAVDHNATQQSMIFDTPQGGGVRMQESEEDAHSILRALASDERTNSDSKRCKVAQSSLSLLNILQTRDTALRTIAGAYCNSQE
ncbi:MAG: carboxylesterase/lipase family protein [Halioglobus sp.]